MDISYFFFKIFNDACADPEHFCLFYVYRGGKCGSVPVFLRKQNNHHRHASKTQFQCCKFPCGWGSRPQPYAPLGPCIRRMSDVVSSSGIFSALVVIFCFVLVLSFLVCHSPRGGGYSYFFFIRRLRPNIYPSPPKKYQGFQAPPKNI